MIATLLSQLLGVDRPRAGVRITAMTNQVRLGLP